VVENFNLLTACPHCRSKVRQSPNFAVFGDSRTFVLQSHFSDATVWTGLKTTYSY